jgi:streptogramin lyase
MTELVGTGELLFEPVSDWPQLPDSVQLVEAVGVATDSQDRVYIFNRGDPPVLVCDRDGNLQRSWGAGQFVRPHGIWIASDDTIYLTDDCGHSVRQFSSDGELLKTIGPSGERSETGAVDFDHRNITSGGAPYNLPTNSVLAQNGDLYVTDGYGNARVHRFSSSGELLASWGEPGSGPNKFCVPHGIGVDRDGRLYIADRENSRIQILSPDGGFVGEWTDVVRPCEVFVGRNDLVYVAELGARAGLFPWMSPDPAAIGGRVSIFTQDGDVLSRWGNQDDPTKPDALFAPHDIWVDSLGDIYLAEVARSAQPAAGQDAAQFPTMRKFARR